jgi:transcriptional regulator with XRE-family HTH domain
VTEQAVLFKARKSPVAMIWGRNILQQRTACGLSQQRLADAVGVRQAAVAQWESGTTAPSLTNQVRIGRALHVDPRILFAYPQEVA